MGRSKKKEMRKRKARGIDPVDNKTTPSADSSPSTSSSTLEYIARKRMRGMQVLLRARDEMSALERLLIVLEWYLCALTRHRYGKKPLNPVIGETFMCSAGGFRYVSEQVSHHPPVSAFHIEQEEATDEGSEGSTRSKIQLDGHMEVQSSFKGNSILVRTQGCAVLHVGEEEFVLPRPFPEMQARNILIGTFRNEYNGPVVIEYPTAGLQARLEFHTTGTFWGGRKDHVSGCVVALSAAAANASTVPGKGLYSASVAEGGLKPVTSEQVELVGFDGVWSDRVDYTIVLDPGKFACTGGEDTSSFSSGLPPSGLLFRFEEVQYPTDFVPIVNEDIQRGRHSQAVWGDVIDAIWACEWSRADEAKVAVEEAQRALLIEKEAEAELDFAFFQRRTKESNAPLEWEYSKVAPSKAAKCEV